MPSETPPVSTMDKLHLTLLRDHVASLFAEAAAVASTIDDCLILDIAPQDHGGIRPHLMAPARLRTLDIDPDSDADIIGDICRRNDDVADASLDMVICTEVLEHVSNPFLGVAEIHRMLKPGGRAYFSAPFNFRIHGPLPDNWRFSEHGWRQLASPFSHVAISALETEGRFLMPIHYNIVAVK
ncbi:MAG: methyltransferase [Rhodoglobus sp.]|nr:methyltransferase [Rhodoglobus sp.]